VDVGLLELLLDQSVLVADFTYLPEYDVGILDEYEVGVSDPQVGLRRLDRHQFVAMQKLEKANDVSRKIIGIETFLVLLQYQFRYCSLCQELLQLLLQLVVFGLVKQKLLHVGLKDP